VSVFLKVDLKEISTDHKFLVLPVDSGIENYEFKVSFFVLARKVIAL